jgi:hypothetical protein
VSSRNDLVGVAICQAEDEMTTISTNTDTTTKVREWKAFPSRTVFAVFPDHHSAQNAADRLRRSGVSAESIRILNGEEGLEDLDPTGERHGLRGRMMRAVQQLGEVVTFLEGYADQIRAGKTAMAVAFRENDDRQSIASLLIDSGGTQMSYTSDWTITGLVEPGSKS